MEKSQKKKSKTVHATNIWGALERIVIAAINKGQLPILGGIAIVLFIIWKMPPADVSELAFKIFDKVVIGNVIGYIVGGGSIVVCFGVVKTQRRINEREKKRLGKERTKWQERALRLELGTSEQ